MTDLIPRLQTLFDGSVDHARSVGLTTSTARPLLQLFALRFLSVTVPELADLGARFRRSRVSHERRDILETLAYRTETVFPELQGVFTDHMLPTLRSADSLLVQWSRLLDDIGSILKDSAPVFGAWFDSVVDSVGGGGGTGLQYTTPRPLANLMLRLSGAGLQHTIHDPCSGVGSLLAAAVARNPHSAPVSGQEIDPGIAALARLRLFLLGARSAAIKVGDVLRQPQFVEQRARAHLSDVFVAGGEESALEKFDVVLCDPPYGQRLGSTEFAQTDPYRRFQYGLPGRTSSDVAFLQHALACMAPGGCALALIAHGPLFRGGGDAEVRRRLIEADVIEAVVGLPFGTLPGLSIEPALLVCRQHKGEERRQKILFVDASQRRDVLRNPAAWTEFAAELHSIVSEGTPVDGLAYVAETAEIAANQFSLQPRKYVAREEKRDRLDIRATLAHAARFEAEAARHADEMDRLSARLRPGEAAESEESSARIEGNEKTKGHEELAAEDPQPSGAYSVEDALEGLFMEGQQFRSTLKLLLAKKNLILQGPTGVGKTLVSRRLAYALMGEKAPDRLQMIQFHPAYSYEDFVQGLRPAGRSGFRMMSGTFPEFCERAQHNPGARYVFVIDEINRADLSRVFGEVMTLIEPDKRGPEWGIPLASSENRQERFYVPENVYLIGSMNTADRALALVDFGLRRRFAFVDLEPRFDSEQFRAYLTGRGAQPSWVEAIIARMSSLNAQIEADLGANYRVGHSFLCDLPATGAPDWGWYRQAVTSGIAHLLHEYYHDRPEHAAQLLAALLRT